MKRSDRLRAVAWMTATLPWLAVGCAAPVTSADSAPALKPTASASTAPAAAPASKPTTSFNTDTGSMNRTVDAAAASNASTTPSSVTAPIAAATQPIVVDLPDDPELARVGEVAIKQSQLLNALIETRGLDMLLRILQLEMARNDAANRGIILDSSAFERETATTLRLAFGKQDESEVMSAPDEAARKAALAALADEREQMITQFVAGQNQTRYDFDLLMQTNAYLRAMVLPQIQESIDEQTLRGAFSLIHGEKVRVRHIALSNMQEVAEAQRRLAAGEAFAEVARTMSRTPRTAELGGELPAFTRTASGISRAFIDTAFALQVGQVSDPVQYEGRYHLIKLEERIEPKAVKFEDVRDSVRQELEDSLTTEAMKGLRQQYAVRVLQAIEINHPSLKAQFEARREAARPKPADREEVLEKINPSAPAKPEPLQAPASAPSVPPATAPAPAPVPAPAPDASLAPASDSPAVPATPAPAEATPAEAAPAN